MFDPERFRFGSARWAGDRDVSPNHLPFGAEPLIGLWKGIHRLVMPGDSPLVSFAGSGSGKLTDIIAYTLCAYPGRVLVNDPKGELCAISIWNQIRLGKPAFCINPHGLHGLPAHVCALLDILKKGCPRLGSNIKFIAETLIALSGSPHGEFFELKGRAWLAALLRFDVEKHGSGDLPRLFALLQRMIGDSEVWAETIDEMMDSPWPDVVAAAGEMHQKRKVPNNTEFGGCFGEITKSLDFMTDPVLQTALGGEGDADFSLSVLTNPDFASTVYLMTPAEYAGNWGPMIRLIFAVAMLWKARSPESPTVLFLADEAAQMGRTEAILRFQTYGRGIGIRLWSFWQDISQPVRNLGEGATQTILASSQVRQFFGVREYETAKLISEMLGTQTLEYGEPLEQAYARHAYREAIFDFVSGNDPIGNAWKAQYHAMAARHRKKQARALLTPSEVLALPENKQILFVSGVNCPPALADRRPYWNFPLMAGKYTANPYHPPVDRVQIGNRWARVRVADVPPRLRHWPQHQKGKLLYVEGY